MRAWVIPLFALALIGCGPVWMLPGGELSGQVAAPPDDWSFSDSVDTVQLETRPDDPYSVNIWGVGVGPHFYVAAGRTSNRWAKDIAADPNVRLKIDDRVFELRAERVGDDAEIQACLEAIQRKYDFEPDPDQRESATVFRLEPRAAGS